MDCAPRPRAPRPRGRVPGHGPGVTIRRPRPGAFPSDAESAPVHSPVRPPFACCRWAGPGSGRRCPLRRKGVRRRQRVEPRTKGSPVRPCAAPAPRRARRRRRIRCRAAMAGPQWPGRDPAGRQRSGDRADPANHQGPTIRRRPSGADHQKSPLRAWRRHTSG